MIKAGGCDGVAKVVLKFHETWSDPKGRDAASMLMRREIRDLGAEIELRVILSHYERPRRLKPRLDRPFLHLCGMVAAATLGDIHRQNVRMEERQQDKRVVVDFDVSGLPDDLRAAAPVWVESCLDEMGGSAHGANVEA